MNKILTALAALAIAVGGWFTFLRTPPPVPLLSANLEVLAESELEGYCTGRMLYRSQAGQKAASECWQELGEAHAIERDVYAVVPAFCQALVDEGWNGTKYECEQIVERYQLWPTKTGALADDWSESYPYPTDRPEEQKINNNKTTARTGDREENSR